MGKEHNTYVFKWKTKIGIHQNVPNDQDLQKYMDKHAFFGNYLFQAQKAISIEH